jgi:hypothetical protein
MGCANYGAFVAMTSINVLSIAALIAATAIRGVASFFSYEVFAFKMK